MSDNAAIYAEMSQDQVAMVALTDDGDQTKFNSADTLWSYATGYQPDVKPNGIATGGAITPGAANDTVAVAALTCYLAGVLESVSADTALAISRPEASNFQILSITVNSSGAFEIVEGSEHTEFSSVRDAVGGPPLIPTTSIEIGWVKYSSQTPAIVLASEIKQTIGAHREAYYQPGWTERRMEVTNGALDFAGIDFDAALPAIHTGPVPKAVYAEYYTPEFAILPETSDFQPPENTHSANSKQIYGKTKGSSSSTLGQGSFTVFLNDGISDSIVGKKNQFLFFKFLEDRLVTTKYLLCQGKLGLKRKFDPSEDPSAACTVTATDEAVEVYA